MLLFRKTWPVLLIMIGGFALAPPARAQFAINVFAPGDPFYGVAGGVTIFDGAAGDLNPAPNAITIVAGATPATPAMTGFNVNVGTAVTNLPGAPNFALLDLTYTVASLGTAGGLIQITTSAAGYNQPSPAFNPVTLTSAIGGTLGGGGSVTAQQWLNPANTLFGLGPFTPGIQGPFTGLVYSDVDTVTGNITGDFSLTDRVTITLNPGAIATGDLLSTVVGIPPEPIIPEPTSVVLALTGLPFVGAYLRRRWKKEKV